jgi:putative glycosyltransferase (TIGR04372 family)
VGTGLKRLEKIQLSLRLRWVSIWMFIIRLMLQNKIVIPTRIEALNFNTTSPLSNKNLGLFEEWERSWNETDDLERIGRYHDAIKIRRDILEQIYDFYEIQSEEYYPPILGPHWTSNFGHFSNIGHLHMLEAVGEVSKGTRTIISSNNCPNREMLKQVVGDYQLAHNSVENRWTETSNTWHIGERMQMVKTKTGFRCQIELHDSLFQLNERRKEKNLEYLNLQEDYLETAEMEMKKFGLPSSAPFVAFHNRESQGKYDNRTQSLLTFSDSLDFITAQGIWVVRFGDRGMQPLTPKQNIIDLPRLNVETNHLHPYLLAKCVFFLGTISGPSMIPRIFGKPSLITNLNQIATGAQSAPHGSIFLPKHYISDSGHKLSLRELFETKLAFASLNTKELRERGYTIEQNSSQEILSATKEIFYNLYYGQANQPSEENKNVDKIRELFSSPTSGKISESFLELNQNWSVL